MTRRAFLKWLLSLGAVAAAFGIGLWRGWFGAVNRSSEQGGSSASPSPEPAPPEADHNAGETGPLLTLLILSDPHINPDLPEHSKHLAQALEDMKRLPNPPDSVVITGDLTDYGRKQDYQELRKVLGRFELPPLYANMGNHDYYDIWINEQGQFNREGMPNGKSDADSRESFLNFMGQEKPYRDVWIKGVHLILLSQEAYVEERPEVGEGAWYSDQQMAWFKEQMEQHKDGKPAFVMIHQPLPPAGQDGGSHRLIRANEFRDIVRDCPNVFVFSGHQHQDFTNGMNHYVKETFHWFHNSSVSRVMNRRYENARPEAAQGLYVEVYEDRVLLKGREFSDGTWIAEADWLVELARGA
ncbi:cyclic 3',5'-adenosine monophosphate phosphodiesterase [Chlamydia abortus]|uniref:Metallophosphoesterase family protein n=1 Tax=Paenibacillus residui TaxID=629724 RepID=A0ABW3D442_9BACL|nr:cyclic 3',5'-adenosine monophosphate phosphodiesterase [Chlamydia abortus]